LSYHLKSRPTWTNKTLSDDKICFNKEYKITSFIRSQFCIANNYKELSKY